MLGNFVEGVVGNIQGVNLPPFNYMSYSEDPTKFNWLTGGTGAAIPHVFSVGSTITVGTKQQLPDIPGGEVGTGFTCTGACQDPDSTDIWVGNFGNSRGGAGGSQTAISAVRLTANGQTLVSQVVLTQAVGGLQGLAFVTATGIRCLAYADGTSQQVCFVNRDGSIPMSPLSVPFAVNGVAWDNTRQALVLTDAATGDVWWVTLGGILLQYADFNNWGGPLDQVTVDSGRGTGGYLWATTGANGTAGNVIAYDIALDKIVDRFVMSDAKAIEGIIVAGTVVKIFTDGKYHETGSAPNTVAPYNVNEMQTYAVASTLTQWRHSRVYKSNELVGPFGRQPYHILLDRGDGDTSADYNIVTRDADASINGQTIIGSWSGKQQDPLGAAQNLGLRVLSGAALTNKVFGTSYSRPNVTNAFTSGANNTQLGTRGTQTPDRIVSVVGSGLAVQLGSTPVAYRPRLGA